MSTVELIQYFFLLAIFSFVILTIYQYLNYTKRKKIPFKVYWKITVIGMPFTLVALCASAFLFIYLKFDPVTSLVFAAAITLFFIVAQELGNTVNEFLSEKKTENQLTGLDVKVSFLITRLTNQEIPYEFFEQTDHLRRVQTFLLLTKINLPDSEENNLARAHLNEALNQINKSMNETKYGMNRNG